MSELQELISMIYHEKQESGSMLCAQHALNSLLQGAYFSAPDLSEIARNLDLLEEQYNTTGGRSGSKNMDDTGFFSVQVVEAAIEVWGLNLVRWRSNAMRPYQDRPHNQLAFILNLDQHWFTLRRFGHASANIDEDAGQGHWFNLNSFLAAPEWVGKLYLGMVLQQAETEGYSVFVVTQADPSKPLALSRTEADNVAATLPEVRPANPSSLHNATKRNLNVSGASRNVPGNSGSLDFAKGAGGGEGIEDGDYELQAALQASLESREGYGSHIHESSSSSAIPLALADDTPSQSYSNPTSRFIPLSPSQAPQWPNIPGHADADPVAASMERNRVLLQRMREQQEYVHRELQSVDGLTPEEGARRMERRRQEEEDEEQLRRAIVESEAMVLDRNAQQNLPNSDEPPLLDRGIGAASVPFNNFGSGYRNYDDEDSELQAALKASLESVPPGWKPLTQDGPSHLETSRPPHRAEGLAAVSEKAKNNDQNKIEVGEKWRSETEESGDGGDDDDDDGASEMTGVSVQEERGAPPSIDEIRKARLARFGL